MTLRTLGPGARVAVFGASGAIGGAFTQALSAEPAVDRIYACARAGNVPTAASVRPLRFDLEDEASIESTAREMQREGPLDLVLVTTGVLHDGAGLAPEKNWREFSADAFARNFAVNATGPALIAKHLLPLLNTGRRAVFAALSARVGSIEDNRLGGWAAYRASKAALHQVIRTCAIELARRNPAALCVALHPGTVDSALTRPFQRNVPPERLFTPEVSVRHLLKVIDGLEPDDSGFAFAWDGKRIPF